MHAVFVFTLVVAMLSCVLNIGPHIVFGVQAISLTSKLSICVSKKESDFNGTPKGKFKENIKFKMYKKKSAAHKAVTRRPRHWCG